MTDQNTQSNGGRSGGGAGLAFIVGGLLVAVAIIAWFVFGRGMTPETKDVDVDVNLPSVEAPKLPSVEPPSVPSPSPAPAN